MTEAKTKISCYGHCALSGSLRCSECQAYVSVRHRLKLQLHSCEKMDSWEGRIPSTHKIAVNEKIIEHLKPLVLGKEKQAKMITLDGYDLHTSALWVRKLGVLAENICVPAPYKTTHETTMSLPGNEDLRGINLQRGKFVFDVLSTMFADGTLAVVFLDYCATLRGNKHTTPLLDLDLLFSRKLLCSELFPEAVVILEINHRDDRGDERKEERFAEMWGKVGEIATKCGYLIRPVMTLYYSPGMFVTGFSVRKLSSLLPCSTLPSSCNQDKIHPAAFDFSRSLLLQESHPASISPQLSNPPMTLSPSSILETKTLKRKQEQKETKLEKKFCSSKVVKPEKISSVTASGLCKKIESLIGEPPSRVDLIFLFQRLFDYTPKKWALPELEGKLAGYLAHKKLSTETFLEEVKKFVSVPCYVKCISLRELQRNTLSDVHVSDLSIIPVGIDGKFDFQCRICNFKSEMKWHQWGNYVLAQSISDDGERRLQVFTNKFYSSSSPIIPRIIASAAIQRQLLPMTNEQLAQLCSYYGVEYKEANDEEVRKLLELGLVHQHEMNGESFSKFLKEVDDKPKFIYCADQKRYSFSYSSDCPRCGKVHLPKDIQVNQFFVVGVYYQSAFSFISLEEEKFVTRWLQEGKKTPTELILQNAFITNEIIRMRIKGSPYILPIYKKSSAMEIYKKNMPEIITYRVSCYPRKGKDLHTYFISDLKPVPLHVPFHFECEKCGYKCMMVWITEVYAGELIDKPTRNLSIHREENRNTFEPSSSGKTVPSKKYISKFDLPRCRFCTDERRCERCSVFAAAQVIAQ